MFQIRQRCHFCASLLLALFIILPLSAYAQCRTAEAEPNNTDASANAAVCSGVAIGGVMSSGSDLDWYKLTVTGAGTLSISLSHASGVDFDWFLYPATGAYIAYASTSNNPETGSKTITAAGTYYVRVKRFRGTGAYTLNITGPIAGQVISLPTPTIGAFSVLTKTVGDAAFNLAAPTSNSASAFSYTSSNTAVATVSGTLVTILSAGTSTITASQAANTSYAAGSASAVLTVNGGATAWPCTLPTGVNLGKLGSTTDVTRSTTGGTVLMGGGADVDAAIQWMIAKSGGGDAVILRATGSNAYNSYINGLGTLNSVQTLLIDTVAEGDNACVGETIRRAELVFIAGGDQQSYITFFNNRAVGNALNYLITTKKVPVGGTSAGMMIQSQYTHPGGAPNDTTVLNNPTAVAVSNNFLTNARLTNTVTDTHFSQRTRQARLMSFMASTIFNFGVTWQNVRGIACDEATAYALDDNGTGKVFGTNYCFFAKATGAPEVLTPNTALTWDVTQQALNVYRIQGTATGSGTFNVNTFSGTGGVTQFWSANRGTFTVR